MISKLEDVERRFERLTSQLSDPETLGDSTKLQKVAKERSALEKLVETFRSYKKIIADLSEVEAWVNGSDPELKSMGKEELPRLKGSKEALEADLKILLLPKDPNDEKDVIL
jgi:peptide chain release factor 1